MGSRQQRAGRLALPAAPASVSAARAFLAAALASEGVEGEDLFEALLVLSELTTNAIVHGSRQEHDDEEVEVAYALEGAKLSICVRDAAHGRSAPVALTADQERASGRGLQIVDWLADWTEQISDGRREVQAQLELRPRDIASEATERSPLCR